MSESKIDFDNFDVAIPWEDIPDSDTVEEGRYVLRVKELKIVGSKEDKLMVMGMFIIDEGPLSEVPFPIQNYVIGGEDDPQANRDTNTAKKGYGGRQLKQLLSAMNIVMDSRSLRLTLKRADGGRFQAYVTKQVQKTGDYAGQDQNRIMKYTPYGQDMQVPGQPGKAPSSASQGSSQAPRVHSRPVIDQGAAQEMMAREVVKPPEFTVPLERERIVVVPGEQGEVPEEMLFTPTVKENE